MTYVIIVFVIVFLAVGAITIKRNMEIQKNGVEADAVVSRIEEDESAPDEDGHTDTTYIYYVRYQAQDGQTVEAKLSSAPGNLFVGSRLRIKYLPENPKYVVIAK